MSLIVLMAVPPGFFSDDVFSDISTLESDLISKEEQELIDGTVSQLGFLPASVVETNFVYTESDQSLIQKFLDETNSPLGTEKFGIETQVALWDSDQQLYTQSNILGVSQLSVTDEEGRLLDLGRVQITLESISKNVELNADVWGKIVFYLDDNVVGEKYFWGSDQKTDRLELSIIDPGEMNFELEPNRELDLAISQKQAQLDAIIQAEKNESIRTSTASRFTPASQGYYDLVATKPTVIAELNELRNQRSESDVKRALPPAFSVQEKKNFTFTFEDEGLGWNHDEVHVYRAVIEEVHAKLSSDNDHKEFHFNGQFIAYELEMKVNGKKKVVLNSDNKAVEIIKSDITLNSCTESKYACIFCGYEQHRKEIRFSSTVPGVEILDADRNKIQTVTSISGENNCSAISGIPRDSDIIFVVNGKDYPVHTPLSQFNYHITGEVVQTGNSRYTEFIGNVERNGLLPRYGNQVVSNFGYP